jgi:catechol 2,3-dioxygenase-like lactoylglutathione lyase family enzyme
MDQPSLKGLHHVVVPVNDLTEGAAWWTRAFCAERLPDLDHVDGDGRLFAVIMKLPGTAPMLQLRLDDDLARRTAGYGAFAFAVAGRPELDVWAEHLDASGVERTPARTAMIGDVFDVTTPSGLVVRLYTTE